MARRAVSANASWSQAWLMSVRKGPGMIVLTRTLGAKARAIPTVRQLSPALAAA